MPLAASRKRCCAELDYLKKEKTTPNFEGPSARKRILSEGSLILPNLINSSAFYKDESTVKKKDKKKTKRKMENKKKKK